MGENQKISQYFTNTVAPSVFDHMLGPTSCSSEEHPNSSVDVPDVTRDLWYRPFDKNVAVAMLTSPGILSTNDLVSCPQYPQLESL